MYLNLFGEYYGPIFNNLLEKKIIGLQIIQPIKIGYYELAMIKTHWIRLNSKKMERNYEKKDYNQKRIYLIYDIERYMGKIP